MQNPEIFERFKKKAVAKYDITVMDLISQMSWTTGERILDFGCGTGSGTLHIVPIARRYNCTIDGLDISENMIAYAKTVNVDPIVNYSSGDIMDTNPPFDDCSFDKIISIYVLHFIKEHRPILQRLYDMLKPGGQFAFIFTVGDFVFNTLKSNGENTKWKNYMTGYEAFLPDWAGLSGDEIKERFRTSLTKIGFEIKMLEIRGRSSCLPIDVWSDLVLSINPFIGKIPTELQEDLAKDSLAIMVHSGLDTSEKEAAKFSDEIFIGLVVKPEE